MDRFLTEVRHNVGIEPPLQSLSGEHLTLGSANRNGTNCQCEVYKRIASMILPRNMTRHIQQDPPLDQMEIELLTLALSNYMPKRSKIQQSPPCNISRHNGPSLPRRPGPSRVNIDITYRPPCIYCTPFASPFD